VALAARADQAESAEQAALGGPEALAAEANAMAAKVVRSAV
jgi:hypothetical protein